MPDLLNECRLVSHIYEYQEVTSTMDVAESIIKDKGIDSNFVVVAETQTKGRGRKGNHWDSNRGGLWLTLGLFNYSFAPSLMLYTGLMMRRTLFHLLNIDEIFIKWPNDILIGDKKCCGIIANQNSQARYHLIGIGLNTNNDVSNINENYKAISLAEITGKPISNKQVLKTFLDFFFSSIGIFQTDSLGPFIDEFNNFHLLNNKFIEIENKTSYKGLCIGIQEDGGLVLKDASNNEIVVYSGTIKSFL
ncbi:MAG TPA: biotin--[acetyl-CoA-carboxylase] ligase [Candidatus Cloacimonadota bacterium]|nr:biotin--[acetyl-CoA-carboxylase] ligase [Candidatus Cloacimonadota bacterium]HOQ80494.1 biotin--[acetyl-CoA-carboxylase] ligase [Candidatus Cloacimonadota bacterium]HPK41549.1 biotin--[acetyl-CoA-carboxylase] ligase [Candidatus Cloacimonadota bacterium]